MALIEEMDKQGNFLFRYRGVLPILILVPGLVYFAFEQNKVFLEGKPDFLPQGLVQAIALAICLIGFAIRIYTVGHTPRNTSGRNTKAQVADELNTSGVYSLVRHPLYLGNFFMWLGVSVLTMNFWFILAFVLIFWVYYERIMFAEEYFLRGKFGKPYLDWASVTPAFIPSLKNRKPNPNPFNWRKVIVREKTGLLTVFAVFFLFNLVVDSIKNRKLTFEFDFWLVAFIASIFIYLFIKIMRRYIPSLRPGF